MVRTAKMRRPDLAREIDVLAEAAGEIPSSPHITRSLQKVFDSLVTDRSQDDAAKLLDMAANIDRLNGTANSISSRDIRSVVALVVVAFGLAGAVASGKVFGVPTDIYTKEEIYTYLMGGPAAGVFVYAMRKILPPRLLGIIIAMSIVGLTHAYSVYAEAPEKAGLILYAFVGGVLLMLGSALNGLTSSFNPSDRKKSL